MVDEKEPALPHKMSPPKDLDTPLADTTEASTALVSTTEESPEFDLSSIDDLSHSVPSLHKTKGGKISKRKRLTKKGPKGIEWEIAKKVYVTTDLTFVELAHLLGCSEHAVAMRSTLHADDRWTELRKNHRLDMKLHGVERRALKTAMEKSAETQEAGAELALAALQIIVDDLKEWRQRKKDWIEANPAIPFPERIPLSARDINALTSAMNRLEAWDRAKLGSPDAKIAIDVRTVDLTSLLDRAHE